MRLSSIVSPEISFDAEPNFGVEEVESSNNSKKINHKIDNLPMGVYAVRLPQKYFSSLFEVNVVFAVN